ncbi:MAG: hypothetical protein ACE5GB_09195, partial [Acidimicrobiales bacterium]
HLIADPTDFLATVWLPRELMPGWADRIARVNPVSAVADGVRQVLSQGVTVRPVLVAVGAAVAVGGALQMLTARSLLAMIERS